MGKEALEIINIPVEKNASQSPIDKTIYTVNGNIPSSKNNNSKSDNENCWTLNK